MDRLYASTSLLLTLTIILISLTSAHSAPAANSNYGVDLGAGAVNYQAFRCLLSQGYNSVGIRGFEPSAGGQPDADLMSNLQNAQQSGIKFIEVYADVNLDGKRSGGQQFLLLNSYLQKRGTRLNRIWLSIANPVKWGSDVNRNVRVIQDFVQTAQNSGVQAGIYTNWRDWLLATNNYKGLPSNVYLWYFQPLGLGPDAESDSNFNDFRPFGNWNRNNVVAKEFGVFELICGLQPVGRHVNEIRHESAVAQMGERNGVSFYQQTTVYDHENDTPKY